MAGERTEAATPRKIEQLRSQGQVARSADLTTGLEVLLAFVLLQQLGGQSALQLADYIRRTAGGLGRAELSGPALEQLGFGALTALSAAVLPLLLTMPLAGALIGVSQTGLLFSPAAAAPKLNRLNPVEYFQRLFSSRTIVDVAKTLLKIGLVAWVIVTTYSETIPALLSLASTDLREAFGLLGRTVTHFGVVAGGVLFVLGVLDYGYQRWEYQRGARMSKQEVKEEHRQSEGSPQMRQRMRQQQRRLATGRMMQAVPSADVVVTNPTHFAVALLYRGGEMSAPRVVAKGADHVAFRIKELAREHAVPTVENKPLARALYRGVEVGQEIPGELFQAVAEILAHIYALRKRDPLKGAGRGAASA